MSIRILGDLDLQAILCRLTVPLRGVYKGIVCKKWIHKWCSGVCGDLSFVVDGFRCKRCDGTIPETDLADYLVVDGETYECVCYLGDTLDGDVGAEVPMISAYTWWTRQPTTDANKSTSVLS